MKPEIKLSRSLNKIYTKHMKCCFGRCPTLNWSPDKDRQKTIERRITSMIRRRKSFFIEADNQTFLVSGSQLGRVYTKNKKGKWNIAIGLAADIFINRSVKWNSWLPESDQY